jgi:ABC-type multidrug transport system fused ATPase/permease subunit
MADLFDHVETLPQGIHTPVGERGVLLSGGQRQRIAIARALARKPKLLILDEATSALDNESEVKIQNVIKNLKGKLTVLVIAHRLTTIQNADRIIALKNGKIEEEGSPEALLKNKESYFYKVYNIRQ